MKMIRDLNQSLIAEAHCRDFAAIGRVLMLGKGRFVDTQRIAQEAGLSPVARAIVSKAQGGTIAPASPGWGSELADYRTIAASFVESLEHTGAFDAIRPSTVQLPSAGTRVVATTIAASGARSAENAIKQLTEIDFAANELGDRKTVALVALSNDLLKLGGEAVLAFLQSELQKAVARATDDDFVSLMTTPLTPTSGTGTFLGDLRAALWAITGGSGSRYFALIDPANAIALATAETDQGEPVFPGMTPTGGEIAGVRVIAADAMSSVSSPAAGALLVLDAAQIATAAGDVALSSTGEANLDLAGGASASHSLWQRDESALRAERFYSALPVREGYGALIESVDYSGA